MVEWWVGGGSQDAGFRDLMHPGGSVGTGKIEPSTGQVKHSNHGPSPGI